MQVVPENLEGFVTRIWWGREIRSALFFACFDFLRHVGCQNSYEMQAVPQHLSTGTGTGWRRPTGFLKLQVIFRKRATDYRALWRKMTYKDKASCRSCHDG